MSGAVHDVDAGDVASKMVAPVGVNTPPTPDETPDATVYGEDDFLSDAEYIAQVGRELDIEELVEAVDDLLLFKKAGFPDAACRPFMNEVVGHAPVGSAQADEVNLRIVRMEKWIEPCEENDCGEPECGYWDCGWWGCNLDEEEVQA